jgi:hypothetical protein
MLVGLPFSQDLFHGAQYRFQQLVQDRILNGKDVDNRSHAWNCLQRVTLASRMITFSSNSARVKKTLAILISYGIGTDMFEFSP